MGRIAVKSSPTLLRLDEIMRPLVWDGVFGGRFADRVHAIRVFERHVREVRRRVPPERLLVYRVSQGWPPLCEFLGVPVPAGPFRCDVRRRPDQHARQRERRAVLRVGDAEVAELDLPLEG